ncbi:MAG: SAM-dependent methyltransferase, partial [Clostridium sp.]|nr:SAM-dependent methyltransferase [Clostridium sp.]
MEDLKKAIDQMITDDILKIVISNKMNKELKYNKITISIKEKDGNEYYQVEKYTDKQVFHENLNKEDLNEKLMEYIYENFKQVSAWSKDANYDLKISKKGKVHLGRKKSDNAKMAVNKSHNKEKNYILKEGMIIEPLIDLGVFTKEGKVVNSKYDKYKQINRFVEIIDDEIKKNDYKKLTILDFGCGKSYLTFVLYYYFVEIKKIDVKMIGLDLKEDVIKKCNDIAKRYKYDNLHFELGDINGFKYNNKVDMVITLHACDTATDYALYNAIKW